MSDQVKKNIAKAMDIDEGQIMDFKKQENGTYTVLLFSYQKFTGVVPAEPPKQKSTPKKRSSTAKKQTSTAKKRTAAAKHETKKKE